MSELTNYLFGCLDLNCAVFVIRYRKYRKLLTHIKFYNFYMHKTSYTFILIFNHLCFTVYSTKSVNPTYENGLRFRFLTYGKSFRI